MKICFVSARWTHFVRAGPAASTSIKRKALSDSNTYLPVWSSLPERSAASIRIKRSACANYARRLIDRTTNRPSAFPHASRVARRIAHWKRRLGAHTSSDCAQNLLRMIKRDEQPSITANHQPAKRVPTRVPRSAKNRTLEAKTRRSHVKRLRAKPSKDD